MYVHVTRRPDDSAMVSLRDADDCQRFHLAAEGLTLDEVGAALEANGVGAVVGDHAFVDPAVVRRLAEGQQGDGWEERFDAMLRYAATKGWLDEAGRVQAHCELG